MGRHSRIPDELAEGPFTIAQARAAGLTSDHLRGPAWRRIWHGVYARSSLPDTPELTLAAVMLALPFEFVFSGPTAGWLHALDTRPTRPVEVTLAAHIGVSPRYHLRIRRQHLDPSDITTVGGFPATTIERTLHDLANQLGLTDAAVAIDTALRLDLTTAAALGEDASRRAGAKGVRRYRRALAHAEPKSESPMETRLRLLLVLNGLPAPESQVNLHDSAGAFLGRADLYYPDERLAIEYDGSGHRETLTEDNRRQNALVNAGYRLLRFTAPDLRDPEKVACQVRDALRYPPPRPAPPPAQPPPRSRPAGSADPARRTAARPARPASSHPPARPAA
jgi:very-short-patch-repair endonuclease